MNNEEFAQTLVEKEQELAQEVVRWAQNLKILDEGETLEVVVRISKITRPVAVVTIDIPEAAHIFYLRGRRPGFYRRQLSPQELGEISILPISGWKKSVLDFFIQCGNAPTPGKEVLTIAKTNGYKFNRLVGCVNEFNQLFHYRKLPYRLTHDDTAEYENTRWHATSRNKAACKTVSSNSLFRIYKQP